MSDETSLYLRVKRVYEVGVSKSLGFLDLKEKTSVFTYLPSIVGK